jgi:predicted RNA-binding protein YlqC (UPF0109 family)
MDRPLVERAAMKAGRKVIRPARVHIDPSQDEQMRYWTKHLSVSRHDLQKAIDKVGNSASAVRKQLALSRQDQSSGGQ